MDLEPRRFYLFIYFCMHEFTGKHFPWKTLNSKGSLGRVLCWLLMVSGSGSCRWEMQILSWKLWLNCQSCQVMVAVGKASSRNPLFTPKTIALLAIVMTQCPIYVHWLVHSCSLSVSWFHLSVKAPAVLESLYVLKCFSHATCTLCMGGWYLKRNRHLVFRFWFVVGLCLHMMTEEEFLEKSVLSQPVTAPSLNLSSHQGYHHRVNCGLLFPLASTSAILSPQSAVTKIIFLTYAIIILLSCCSCFYSASFYSLPNL